VVVDPLAGEPAAKTMFGPAIPGIDVDQTVATQQDVDALLDGLGL
jgi:chemotaxis regulatin CheY-phosphate phosphatase CheZ